MNRCVLIGALTTVTLRAAAADSFAVSVAGYVPGANPSPGYTNPAVALGEPTRFTGVGVFPSAVTPFNAPFLDSEIVSIGEGGSLTLGFDHPITNDPAHPFGFDLLVFGNAFYIDSNYPTGTAAGIFGGGGIVEVSADADTWAIVPGTQAVSNYPTLGYSDLTDPYSLVPGTAPSDFTVPVDPSFNPIGLTFGQIVAGYNGSGGGTGVNIGAAGVSSILYVRISNPVGSGSAFQIDGVAAVAPAPGTWCVGAGSVILAARRRTRR